MQLLAFQATLVRSFWSHMSPVFVLAILMSGCWAPDYPGDKLYEGPDLTESEISIVYRWSRHEHGWSGLGGYLSYTEILQIDGVEGKRNELIIHVLPGQHTALVASSGGEPSGCCIPSTVYQTVNFPTEAGKKYKIYSWRIDDGPILPGKMQALWIWVLEFGTGNVVVVAGEKDPEH